MARFIAEDKADDGVVKSRRQALEALRRSDHKVLKAIEAIIRADPATPPAMISTLDERDGARQAIKDIKAGKKPAKKKAKKV